MVLKKKKKTPQKTERLLHPLTTEQDPSLSCQSADINTEVAKKFFWVFLYHLTGQTSCPTQDIQSCLFQKPYINKKGSLHTKVNYPGRRFVFSPFAFSLKEIVTTTTTTIEQFDVHFHLEIISDLQVLHMSMYPSPRLTK